MDNIDITNSNSAEMQNERLIDIHIEQEEVATSIIHTDISESNVIENQTNNFHPIASDSWLNEIVWLNDGNTGIVVKVQFAWYYVKSKTTGDITKHRRQNLRKYDPNIPFTPAIEVIKSKSTTTTSVHPKKSSSDINKRKHNDENGAKSLHDNKSSRNVSSSSGSTTDTNNMDLCQNVPSAVSIAPSVVLSMRDKSRGLVLSKDQLTCYGTEVRSFTLSE